MLAFLMAAIVTAAPLPFDNTDEVAARGWIAEYGHSFTPEAIKKSDLEPIVKKLSGARVIGIGEATHGTHQDEAFKVELIKALVESGAIDTLAIECNRAAAWGFDRYVNTGAGDATKLIYDPSFFAIWRNDEFASLVLWLRAWRLSSGKEFHIMGIDLQDSGTDADFALAFLAEHDPAAAASLRARFSSLVTGASGKPAGLANWRGDASKDEYRAVQRAASDLKSILERAPADWRSAPGYPEAAYASKVAWQGLYTFENEYKGADSKNLKPAYYNRRDDLMAENLTERLGDGHAAMWAHDEHVAKGYGPHDEALGWHDLGGVLRDKLDSGYRTVGFTWSQATIRAVRRKQQDPMPLPAQRHYEEISLSNERPGDYGHVFNPLNGDGWWIDISSRPHTGNLDRWGARPVWHGFAGWFVDPDRWQIDPDDDPTNPPDYGFDVMVWFRHMGPNHAWPQVDKGPHE